MFKVPATDPGFEAIEELLASGININITLIFSLDQYVKSARSFLKGMRRLAEKRDDLSAIASVASVFVSRIDTVVDARLAALMEHEKDEYVRQRLRSLLGKAAVANSAIIFQKCAEIFSGDEFGALKERGARPQRVLWGSTSTKNPAYTDIKYVTELIGKNTVNTMPDATFTAFLDHGSIDEALTADARWAREIIEHLTAFGIDIDAVCGRLLDEGVAAFEKSFDSLLATIGQRMTALCT
jgi:transaldolase